MILKPLSPGQINPRATVAIPNMTTEAPKMICQIPSILVSLTNSGLCGRATTVETVIVYSWIIAGAVCILNLIEKDQFVYLISFCFSQLTSASCLLFASVFLGTCLVCEPGYRLSAVEVPI